jgi:eukaryotic-like serine/threonine-protein kinase
VDTDESTSDARANAAASGELEGVPEPGTIIDGKYRVERRLGSGGMGVVLAVTHLVLGERYAIKCLLPKAARDPAVNARFLREARAAARIKSEHIARVADVGQLADGAPFIVMEHLVGADLSEILADHGPLPIGEAVAYVLQACAAIAEAHAIGIIHRDLKPSNLFLTQRSDGTPLLKVLDFGIAKALDEQRNFADVAVTDTAAAFGTPAYMSPEQLRSSKNVDVRTDIWGLGAILYELLAGRRPFDAETPLAMLAALVADPPHPLRLARPEVSPELEAAILKCLEKDTSQRYATVAELADALGPFAERGAISLGRIRRILARPGPTSSAATATTLDTITEKELVGQGGRTPRVRAALLVALGAGVVALGGGAILFRPRPPDRIAPPPSALVATGDVSAFFGAASPPASGSPSGSSGLVGPESSANAPPGAALAPSVGSARPVRPGTRPKPVSSRPPKVPRDPTADSH